MMMCAGLLVAPFHAHMGERCEERKQRGMRKVSSINGPSPVRSPFKGYCNNMSGKFARCDVCAEASNSERSIFLNMQRGCAGGAHPRRRLSARLSIYWGTRPIFNPSPPLTANAWPTIAHQPIRLILVIKCFREKCICIGARLFARKRRCVNCF